MHVGVLDGGLAVDEVFVVLGIEDSPIDVTPSKRNDGVVAVPEADRQEFSAIASGRLTKYAPCLPGVASYSAMPVAKDVLGISLGVFGASPTSPGPRNHSILLLGAVERRGLIGDGLLRGQGRAP